MCWTSDSVCPPFYRFLSCLLLTLNYDSRAKPSSDSSSASSLHSLRSPGSVQLRSGWDDTLDESGGVMKHGHKFRRPLPRLQTSRISSATSDSQALDTAFAQATMKYVTSPVGRSLTSHRRAQSVDVDGDETSSIAWMVDHATEWPSPPKPVHHAHVVSRHDSLLLSPTAL